MKVIKKYGLRVLIASLVHIFFKVTTAPSFEEMVSWDSASWVYFLYTQTVVLVAWELGDRFYAYFSNRYKGIFMTARPLIIFSTTCFVVIGIFLAIGTYFLIFYIEPAFGCPQPENLQAHYVAKFISSQMITLLFIAGFIINHFWQYKQQSQVLQERIIKENVMYKYESLKSQLDPHFLFNNFSVLTSLVHKNPDLASDFISQLSKIYRYVLENKEKELVPVEDEIEFLESYLFLLKIRHDEGIEVDYDLKLLQGEYAIPALSLQLLAENAAKHNNFSAEAPLKLQVFSEAGKYLVIRNTKKIRKNVRTSTKIGLKNIDERYKLISEEAPVIEEDDQFFTVKLPLISKRSA